MATDKSTTVVDAPTAMAVDLKAQTDQAVKAVMGGGFDDPEFEKSLQAAIDKDLGKQPEPVKDSAEPEIDVQPDPVKPPVSAPANAKKVEDVVIPDGLPPEIFGGKPVAKAPDEASAKAEAERQKYLEEQTKGMTPKAAERFKKIELRAYDAEQKAKKMLEEMEAEKAAIKKQIQELSSKTVDKKDDEEYNKLKKELEEYQGLVQKNAISEDPRFKARYDSRIASVIETAKSKVPAEKAEETAELLALPPSKKKNQLIKEFTQELDEFERNSVVVALDKIDEISSERNKELSNWKENFVHVQAKSIDQQRIDAERIANEQKVAWNAAMTAMASPDTGLEVFRRADGNEDWNSRVEARIAKVQSIVSSADIKPAQFVELAARAVASEDYRDMFLAQRMLVHKLVQEINALKTAEPNTDSGGAPPSNAPDNRSFADAAVDGAVQAGGLRR